MATKSRQRQPARPVGRPTKYDPAYCDQIVEFCKQGYSLTAFAGSIGVSRETISEWMRVHPDFSAAAYVAKAAAALVWEQRAGRVGDRGGGPGTATIIMFKLKNFAATDYSEKQHHEISGALNLVISSDDAKL